MTQCRRSQSIGLLLTVVLSAVLLWALAAMVQPPPVVHADSPPQIEAITVTSSQGTYFYSPVLGQEGGEVYFNSVGGEGAGQVLTVTVTVTGTMPITLTGAPAFGDIPPPDNEEPWEITYTVEISTETQSGIVFTATNTSGTDTAIITFTQDITDPMITDPHIDESSDYLYAADLTIYYGDDMGWVWQPFTVNGSSNDTGVGLDRAEFSSAFGQPQPNDDTEPSTWSGGPYLPDYQDWGNGTITVTVFDLVGNSATQIFTYTRDVISPTISYGSPPITETSPYLHAYGTTVYYSDQMGGTAQSFTVQGNAADNGDGAGLWRATFSSPDLNDPGDDLILPDWSGIYYVESSDSGDGTITVKVYDNVSNWSTGVFTYIEDTTNPTVTLTYVTAPGYDEDNPDDPFDADGSNWYNAGDFINGNWVFTSTTADDGAGLASGTALWDHSNNGFDRLPLDCGTDGDGIFPSASTDAEGTVTVTVTITDNVGNPASVTVGFNIDNTEPTITSLYISEGSDYLYADGLTIYYGDEMGGAQTFTVNGSSNDNTAGVGLDRAEFSEAFNNTPSPDYEPSTWSRSYYPDNQDWGNGTITVTVYDHLDNAAYENFYYIRDAEPPTVDVDCPAVTSQPSWSVSWSGWDPPPSSGLDHFDIQYREESGNWQDWLMDTSLTEATFGPTSPLIVEDDHTYYFRVRAEDNVSNESPYTNGEDATTYHSGIKKVFLPILMAPDPNWGFELGNFTNWQHGGQLAQSVQAAPRSGSYSALLGSTSYACNGVPVGNAWLRRSVTVPTSGSPTLSFWYRIRTQDKNSALSDQYDFFAVYINDSVEVVRDANTTQQEGCGTPHDLGWKQVVFSLDGYQGQTIQITFYNYNRPDTWYNTYIYIDDVSVQ